MNQIGSVILILVVLIFVLINAGGYFVFVKKSEPITQRPASVPTQKIQATTPAVSLEQNSNLETYTNTKYSYQISYPKEIYTTENLFNPREVINPDNVRLLDIKSAQNSIKCQCGEAISIVISAYSNPQKLSPEDYLKQNFQRWLGSPSNYYDFYINEPATINGIVARKFGTERDQYFLFMKGDTAFTIAAFDHNVLKTFKFTN